jgi:hypothetical protein
MAIIARLRTGHIVNNQYLLHRIGKLDTPEYKCGAEVQNVNHILTKCLAIETVREVNGLHDTMEKLLWTATGIPIVKNIWSQFLRWKHQLERRDSEAQSEPRELEMGWDNLREE